MRIRRTRGRASPSTDRVYGIGPAELPAAPQRGSNTEPLDDRRRYRQPEEPEERERRQHVQTQQDRERQEHDEPTRYALTNVRRGGRSEDVSAHAYT